MWEAHNLNSGRNIHNIETHKAAEPASQNREGQEQLSDKEHREWGSLQSVFVQPKP